MTIRKLTDTEIAQIKSAAMDGIPLRKIASHHKISCTHVHRISRGDYRPDIAPAADLDTGAVYPSSRICPESIRDDVIILRGRGLSLAQIAAQLHASRSTVARAAAQGAA